MSRKEFETKDNCVIARYVKGNHPNTILDEVNNNTLDVIDGCLMDADILTYHKLINDMSAKATCDESDKFSQYKGEDLAGSKLDYKYHDHMVRDYDKVIKKLTKTIDYLNELKNSHLRKRDNIKENIERVYH